MPVYDRYKKIREHLLGAQDPNELAALQSAEESAMDARNVAGIGSGVDKIISSIAGTEANPQPYDTMQKYAAEGPNRVKEYLKQKYQQQQSANTTAATMAAAEEQAAATAAREKAAAKREAAKGTPAQQELEKKDAEIASDWDSSGRESFNSGMTRLESVKKKLGEMKESTIDKTRARFGENALSDEQLRIQQDVINAALPTLKATFPGNTSNQELMTHAKSFVDFRLSPAENVKNIELKMEEMRAKAAAKEKSASRFGRTPSAPQQSAPANDTPPPGATMRRKRPDGTWEYK